jgi:hypothetical protein
MWRTPQGDALLIDRRGAATSIRPLMLRKQMDDGKHRAG